MHNIKEKTYKNLQHAQEVQSEIDFISRFRMMKSDVNSHKIYRIVKCNINYVIFYCL